MIFRKFSSVVSFQIFLKPNTHSMQPLNVATILFGGTKERMNAGIRAAKQQWLVQKKEGEEESNRVSEHISTPVKVTAAAMSNLLMYR